MLDLQRSSWSGATGDSATPLSSRFTTLCDWCLHLRHAPRANPALVETSVSLVVALATAPAPMEVLVSGHDAEASEVSTKIDMSAVQGNRL